MFVESAYVGVEIRSWLGIAHWRPLVASQPARRSPKCTRIDGPPEATAFRGGHVSAHQLLYRLAAKLQPIIQARKRLSAYGHSAGIGRNMASISFSSVAWFGEIMPPSAAPMTRSSAAPARGSHPASPRRVCNCRDTSIAQAAASSLTAAKPWRPLACFQSPFRSYLSKDSRARAVCEKLVTSRLVATPALPAERRCRP